MTDVLKIALERRAELHEEVSKLDDFIRMAESLIRNSTRHVEDVSELENPNAPRANLLRRGPTAING